MIMIFFSYTVFRSDLYVSSTLFCFQPSSLILPCCLYFNVLLWYLLQLSWCWPLLSAGLHSILTDSCGVSSLIGPTTCTTSLSMCISSPECCFTSAPPSILSSTTFSLAAFESDFLSWCVDTQMSTPHGAILHPTARGFLPIKATQLSEPTLMATAAIQKGPNLLLSSAQDGSRSLMLPLCNTVYGVLLPSTWTFSYLMGRGIILCQLAFLKPVKKGNEKVSLLMSCVCDWYCCNEKKIL